MRRRASAGLAPTPSAETSTFSRTERFPNERLPWNVRAIPSRPRRCGRGRGSWRWCRWTGDGIEPDGDATFVAHPMPEIGVALALIKGDRLDWAVQKLTEVGVDRIIPMAAERCVVRWDDTKRVAQVERLRRIAREASMQSRRVWLPVVDDLAPAASVLGRADVWRADLDGRGQRQAAKTVGPPLACRGVLA